MSINRLMAKKYVVYLCVCVCVSIYNDYSAMRKKEMLLFLTTWIDLDGIML